MPHCLVRLAAAALTTGAIVAAPTATAGAAASLTTNRQCYTAGQRLVIHGTGFQPGSLQTFFLNDDPKPIGTSVPSSNGTILTEFTDGAPFPFEKAATFRHSTYRLIASSSPTPERVTARTSFDVVHTVLTFKPFYITPGRVRFRALGFNTGRYIYIHYLRHGRHLVTKRLGRALGHCGTLRRRARLFLFRPVPAGDYKLVFDNNSTYSPSYAPNFSFEASVATTYR